VKTTERPARARRKKPGRSITEKLLLIGIVTFFLWPLIQLWSLDAMPLVDSDVHQRATNALLGVLAEQLSRPFATQLPPWGFQSVKGYEDLGLESRVEIVPHPSIEGMVVIRAFVRWGVIGMRKTLMAEAVQTRARA
jgi:hypothetical protein